ncbi:hypothetical protein [Acinetobacter sp.]|uniref:hypothetical protein n=1 Tax=Acinetobacter sp. TaxID=472 RepID=UPI0031DDDF11
MSRYSFSKKSSTVKTQSEAKVVTTLQVKQLKLQILHQQHRHELNVPVINKAIPNVPVKISLPNSCWFFEFDQAAVASQ